MHAAARSTAALLLLLALNAPCAGAQPEALERAAAVRAKLPAPGPTTTIDFEGDLVINGLWAGETQFTLRAAKVGTQVVWRMTEQTFVDWQGKETRTKTILHLGQDLSILSGSSERKVEADTVTLVITRTPEGFLLQRRAKTGDDWGEAEMLEMAAPAGTTHGVAALLLFLRALPADERRPHAFPRVDAWPYQGEPAAVPTATLEPVGPATFGEGKGKRKSWSATLAFEGQPPITFHLTPDRQALLGGRRVDGKVTLDVVPRGEGGQRVRLEDEKPAATWKEAFLKFGYGYHQARRDLLSVAFHWEGFFEHETKVLKRWPAERPLADFKQAWIDEFCAQSKHRSDKDAKRLLDMTLATGKVKKQTATAVVFAAHANFGGGTQRTYYLEKRDGVWGIVRIDFEG
jgi:hypothetical protein